MSGRCVEVDWLSVVCYYPLFIICCLCSSVDWNLHICRLIELKSDSCWTCQLPQCASCDVTYQTMQSLTVAVFTEVARPQTEQPQLSFCWALHKCTCGAFWGRFEGSHVLTFKTGVYLDFLTRGGWSQCQGTSRPNQFCKCAIVGLRTIILYIVMHVRY